MAEEVKKKKVIKAADGTVKKAADETKKTVKKCQRNHGIFILRVGECSALNPRKRLKSWRMTCGRHAIIII